MTNLRGMVSRRSVLEGAGLGALGLRVQLWGVITSIAVIDGLVSVTEAPA